MSQNKSTPNATLTSGDAESLTSRPDRFVEKTIANARASTERAINDVTAYTKTNPRQALLTAIGAGYVLRMLPTARVLGGLIQLALPLVVPAAFLYGASKVIPKR